MQSKLIGSMLLDPGSQQWNQVERQDDQMLVILLSMQELTVYYASGFDLTAYKSRKQCILNGRIRGGVVNYPKT